MTQKYHFVHVTLKGNKGAVIALVYMYFGHIDNIKIKENKDDTCAVTLTIPVSDDEIDAELNERLI